MMVGNMSEERLDELLQPLATPKIDGTIRINNVGALASNLNGIDFRQDRFSHKQVALANTSDSLILWQNASRT